jgi:hypothetical protein
LSLIRLLIICLCLCLCFTARFKTFCILYHLFITCLIFIFLGRQISAHNILLTSIFTSYYFVVLLKLTCEVTSLSLPNVTQFQNCRLAIPQKFGRRFLTSKACFRTQIVPFGLVTKKLSALHGFLLVFLFPINILTQLLRTNIMTTVDAT